MTVVTVDIGGDVCLMPVMSASDDMALVAMLSIYAWMWA